MKFKVRGLVFVGFAAAILSANAMAASDNTVTSKSYVDTHFQQKSTAASIGNSEGSWTPVDTEVTDEATSVPTTAAIKDYVDDQISSVTGGASTTYQSKSNNNYQIGGSNGSWASLGTGFADGTYTTKSVDANGVVTIDANGTTDTTLALTGETGKLPTAATVKTYVDNAISAQHTTDNTTYQSYQANANMISGANGGWKALGTTLDTEDPNYDASGTVTAGTIAAAISASESATTYTSDNTTITKNGNQFSANTTNGIGTGNGNLVTGGQVQTALDGKQNLDNGTQYMVSKAGAWQTVDNAVAVTGPVTRTVDSTTGALTIGVDTTGGVANDGDNLVTGGQVYDYVQTQTNGQVLPMPTGCNAQNPCALITDGATGSPMWVPIAQAEASVGTGA